MCARPATARRTPKPVPPAPLLTADEAAAVLHVLEAAARRAPAGTWEVDFTLTVNPKDDPFAAGLCVCVNPLVLAARVTERDRLICIKKSWFHYQTTRYVAISNEALDGIIHRVCEAAAEAEYLRQKQAVIANRQKLQRLRDRLRELDEGAADAGVREHLEAAEKKLQKQVEKEAQSEGTVPKITEKLVKDVRGALRGLCQVGDDTAPNTWLTKAGRRVLSCQNGLLDLDDFTLHPHDPDFFTLAALPVVFDPAAPPPSRFLRFLDEVVQADPERAAVLQEVAGACLDPGLVFKHFVMLTGAGNNGKSVYLVVLLALLGFDNVSAVTLEEMTEKFGTWPLYGKLANLVADQSFVESRDEGILKKLTGGRDLIAFEDKFKSKLLGLNTAKLLFNCNTPPTFADKSDATWNRLVLVPFEYTVPPEKQNPDFLKAEHWAGELSGVLNWAIAGLVRFRTARRLTQSLKCEAANEQHRLDSNPARSFLLAHYTDVRPEVRPDARMLTSTVYESYRLWMDQNGFRYPLDSRRFGREIPGVFKHVEQPDNPITVGGKKGRGWLGLIERDDNPPPKPQPRVTWGGHE